jgi:hypothetical protein
VREFVNVHAYLKPGAAGVAPATEERIVNGLADALNYVLECKEAREGQATQTEVTRPSLRVASKQNSL